MVHPFDNAVGLLCLLFGVLMAVALLTRGGYNPSSSLMRLPPLIGFVVSACLTLGGALSLVGLHWTGDTVSRGWHIERAGWLFVTGGLAGFGAAVAWFFPGSTNSWLLPGVLALAAFVRWLSLILLERNTRRTLAVVQKESRGQ
jgi:hypothetical protein